MNLRFSVFQPDGYVLFRDYAIGDLAQVKSALHFVTQFISHVCIVACYNVTSSFLSNLFLVTGAMV